jgi:SNF2 family DNA or RNA helicase
MAYAEIAPDGSGLIWVQTTFTEKEQIKLVPGAHWDGRNKIWNLPLSWASMITMRGIFGEAFTYGQQLLSWTWHERQTRVDPANALREVYDIAPDGYLWAHSVHGKPLFPCQVADVLFMDVAGDGLLGNEAGTGKTPSACALLRKIGDEALPALVICTNGTKWHWRDHLHEWTPGVSPYIVDGGAVKGRKTIAEAREDPKAVVIVNIESARVFSRLAPFGSMALKRCRECDPRHGDEISAARCEVHPKEFNSFPFKTVIVDEAHRIGEPKTKQSRAVWAILHQPTVTRRWGMTGSADNVERLWSIMHGAAPHEYPVKSKWIDRYALTSWNVFGGLDVIGLKNETRAEAFTILNPRFRRMLKAIVLPQLPPVLRPPPRLVNMTPSQRKAYDQLDKQLHTRLSDGQLLLTSNWLVARTRQMQFSAGTIEVEKPDPDDLTSWKIHLREPAPKLDEMEFILDEVGNQQVAVSAVYRELLDLGALRLGARGTRHALYTGAQSPYERQLAWEAFFRGDLQVLLYTIATGGTGIDLSNVPVLVNLQRSWSLIENIQNEDRISRPGAERHTSQLIIDIVTRDSREVDQIEALHRKLYQLDEIGQDKQRLIIAAQRPGITETELASITAKLGQLDSIEQQLLSIDDLGAIGST